LIACCCFLLPLARCAPGRLALIPPLGRRVRLPQNRQAVEQRLKERGMPHKIVIGTITRGLITGADAILKPCETWWYQPGDWQSR